MKAGKRALAHPTPGEGLLPSAHPSWQCPADLLRGALQLILDPIKLTIKDHTLPRHIDRVCVKILGVLFLTKTLEDSDLGTHGLSFGSFPGYFKCKLVICETHLTPYLLN